MQKGRAWSAYCALIVRHAVRPRVHYVVTQNGAAPTISSRRCMAARNATLLRIVLASSVQNRIESLRQSTSDREHMKTARRAPLDDTAIGDRCGSQKVCRSRSAPSLPTNSSTSGQNAVYISWRRMRESVGFIKLPACRRPSTTCSFHFFDRQTDPLILIEVSDRKPPQHAPNP